MESLYVKYVGQNIKFSIFATFVTTDLQRTCYQ